MLFSLSPGGGVVVGRGVTDDILYDVLIFTAWVGGDEGGQR